MEEIIQVADQHYILATSPRADDRSRVLKHGDTFAVFDRFGDIRPVGLGEEGLYHEGTRFLSRLTLRLNGRHALLLSSTVREDNALLTVDLTNPDISENGRISLARDMLHVMRNSFLWESKLYTRLVVRNFDQDPVEVLLDLAFDADYADIFEVRGEKRPRRGNFLPAEQGEHWVELAYEGLDGVTRRTRLEFSEPPAELARTRARLQATIAPQGQYECFVTATCTIGEPGFKPPTIARRHSTQQRTTDNGQRTSPGFDDALQLHTDALLRSRDRDAEVTTSNDQFNEWLQRSATDLHLMITRTPEGPYPYAGVPWFSTPFGRDGIITAFEYLWINPGVAGGVLQFLAATQADAVIPEQDAEPGKILHEARKGEMAALGEIPFGRYYGTVDATPLFVFLAGAYYERTGDRGLIESIWPNIERALGWIENYGDMDRDGLIEYARKSKTGLVTQGWKDSWDSVFHADGKLAEGPIALCEVQGYVYAAWKAAAGLALMLGRSETADDLLRRADRLRERFEEAFWCEDLSTYALALDGAKRPCRIRASNAGHCLFAGIADPARAARTARTLLDASSFSGWGIRTVAKGEARYNPMAYHNGSIWPHDNALIGYGLGRYGLNDEVLRLLDGLFGASQSVDLRRMPELFCGFARRAGEGPTLYPVACAPQAWAAGSAFLLLQACLGLSIHAPRRSVRFLRPALPEWLEHVEITNLHVAGAVLDVAIHRYSQDVGVNILRREGDVEVVVVK